MCSGQSVGCILIGISLQATWIRNTILRAVRETSDQAADRLPVDVVFKAPTVSSLADAVLHTVRETSSTVHRMITAQYLEEMAEQYAAGLDHRPFPLRPRPRTKDVVVITGTTGGFGCDVLEHLLRDEDVGMVYAFNRRGSRPTERQRVRFRERGLDESLLGSPRFRMVEVELDAPGFGVDPILLEEVLVYSVSVTWLY